MAYDQSTSRRDLMRPRRADPPSPSPPGRSNWLECLCGGFVLSVIVMQVSDELRSEMTQMYIANVSANEDATRRSLPTRQSSPLPFRLSSSSTIRSHQNDCGVDCAIALARAARALPKLELSDAHRWFAIFYMRRDDRTWRLDWHVNSTHSSLPSRPDERPPRYRRLDGA